MEKAYIVRAQRIDDGRFIDSDSDNPTQRIRSLKGSINVANGKKEGRHFDRFDTFLGSDPETDVTFRVFKAIKV